MSSKKLKRKANNICNVCGKSTKSWLLDSVEGLKFKGKRPKICSICKKENENYGKD